MRAAGIAAEKFDDAALDAVEHEIGAEDLAVKSLPRAQPHEQKKIQELRGGFVKLRGMQRDAAAACRQAARRRRP